jgi:heptosyltransferase II
MEQVNKILIRLPNWLGDMVFSTAFVKAVNEQFPGARVDVIAKKGIEVMLDYFPAHHTRYLFDKKKYKGLAGAWKFGKEIASKEKYDIFFSLPDSISAAVMGYATGAKKRIGYKKELRSIFLTDSYIRKANQYHVDAYIGLLEKFTGKTILNARVNLTNVLPVEKNDSIVININSEAQSRKWPKEKAISIINAVRENISQEIILVGSPAEKEYVDNVYEHLKDKTKVTNLAGKSPLPLLVTLMSNCKMVISSESGPAQISNALGTSTLITLGASNELLSTPQKDNNITTIRYGKLPCEPCLKNTCSKFPQPECLIRIDETLLVEKIKSILSNL